jgi:hypothetical protein
VLPIWPDHEGDRQLSDWLEGPHATPERVAQVKQLIDDISWGRSWQTRWHAVLDIITRSDWIVRLPDGPTVVIRPFSDENPQTMFGVVALIPGSHPDDQRDG